MSDVHELESRIERLEARVAQLEIRGAGTPPVERPIRAGATWDEDLPGAGSQPADARPSAIATSDRSPNLLAVAGFCSLILGGAFVLRALTESQMLPRLAGAILGLTYAAFWIWRANRYYAITAAAIAFPLLWETSVRFQIITPLLATVLIAVFAFFFLWIAIRTKQQVLAWVGSVGAVSAAFAIGPSVATLIAVSAIGAAITFAAPQWEFVPWPSAIGANVIALILLVMRPAGVAIVLVLYAVLWLRCPVQSTIAILIGLGGAAYLLIPDLPMLAVAACGAGVVAAEIARWRSSRELSIQSTVWLVAAAILNPFTGIAALIAFFRLRWREERLVLLAVFLYGAFMAIDSVISAPLIRTAILASFACALAVAGRLTANWESSVLARVVLVAGGVKLIVEDLRLGSAATLVIAFALYGAALIVVSRYKTTQPVQ